MAKNAKRPQKGSNSKIRPGAVVVAIVSVWAALNLPISFDLLSIAVWVCAAIAVGLFAYAIITLVIPGLAILFAYSRRTFQQIQHTDFNDIGENN